jgi:hypothetical protein
LPDETDAELIVDSNAVLAFPIAFERFQVIARYRRKILQAFRVIQGEKAFSCRAFDALISFRKFIAEQLLGFGIPE